METNLQVQCACDPTQALQQSSAIRALCILALVVLLGPLAACVAL